MPHPYLRVLTSGPNPTFELWSSQVEALTDRRQDAASSILSPEARRVVLGMPTSAGKTLLAEFMIVAQLFESGFMPTLLARRNIAIYIAPTRALITEIIARLRERLLDIGVNVTGILGGFDQPLVLQDLLTPETPQVLVMTPEKLSLVIHAHRDLLSSCGLIIFDEAHMTAEGSRGWTLEEVISWTSSLLQETRDTKLVFLSAAMHPTDDYLAWLSSDGKKNTVARITTWRPTRQVLGVCHFPPPPWPNNFPTELEPGRKSWSASGSLHYVTGRDLEIGEAPRRIDNGNLSSHLGVETR